MSPMTTDDDNGNDNGKQNVDDDGDKNKGHGLMIFAILVSVVLAVCIIANIIYCYKRKVNEKIAGEILQQQVGAAEGGVDEIALDPMDQHFESNVARKKDAKKKKNYVKFE